jgi:hypothetical protein
VKEKVVDALEFLTADIGSCREVKHALQADRWFLTFAVAFTDETWPHGVMQFRECAHIMLGMLG